MVEPFSTETGPLGSILFIVAGAVIEQSVGRQGFNTKCPQCPYQSDPNSLRQSDIIKC